MDIPDLNDVRVFVAIGREGTLTAAAKELNLPTSTVSRALIRLEKHLDVLLVQRSPRGLILTDFGKEYLQACRRALRNLRDGSDLLDNRRERPSGILKIACPITMARLLVAPLLPEFLNRYPDLRVEIEPYCTGWDQEGREDVDIFFKVRAPRDSARRVRPYPGTKRGLFASADYVAAFGKPSTPDDLVKHICIGSGTWKLSRGSKLAAPDIVFKVVTSDPIVHQELVIRGAGIAILPLYLARLPELLNVLVPILPLWSAEPITVCALFSGPARLTPKVEVFLDFLAEFMGTDLDPRLPDPGAKGLFTESKLQETSGP